MIDVIKANKGIIEVNKDFFNMYSKCSSKDDLRPYLHGVYYSKENNELVAINGSQLVSYKVDDVLGIESVEEGYFDLVKIGKQFKLIPNENNAQFPNYRRVSRDYQEERFNNETLGISPFKSDYKLNQKTICKIIIESGMYIDTVFLELLKHFGEFTIKWGNDNEPIQFYRTDERAFYVFMPLRD